jgi:hypothetical protein
MLSVTQLIALLCAAASTSQAYYFVACRSPFSTSACKEDCTCYCDGANLVCWAPELTCSNFSQTACTENCECDWEDDDSRAEDYFVACRSPFSTPACKEDCSCYCDGPNLKCPASELTCSNFSKTACTENCECDRDEDDSRAMNMFEGAQEELK